MSDESQHWAEGIEPCPPTPSERLSDALSDLRAHAHYHRRSGGSVGRPGGDMPERLAERLEMVERALMLALATLADMQEEREGG